MKKIIKIFAALAILSASNFCLASDELALLDSLLARGLIAPSDYLEQKQLLNKTSKKQFDRSIAVPTSNNDISLLSSEQMIVASNDQPSSKHQSESSHSEHSENHFAGPYIVLTNEWKRASAKVDGEKISKSESAPSFSIGYTYALNSSYTLGLKISADFKSGEYGAGEVAARAVGSETKVVEKNHYSIAVEPGYVVNNQLLVFGILAYHTALAEIEGAAGSARMNGVGYGLGFKHTIADHLFLMGELQQIGYGSKTIDGSTVKPSSTVGAIGLGYHF